MKFPYYRLPSKDPSKPWRSLPLIPVKIFSDNQNTFFECYTLVDSGADKSLFNLEVARSLNLDMSSSSEEVFSGIEGGKLKARVKDVRIQVAGDNESFVIPVGFVDDSSFLGILGQEGFFDKFSITFTRRKLELELKK